MLKWLRRRRDQQRTARVLYGSIVTQGRQGDFYARAGVPDSAEGRFEMLVLHLVLVLHRLGGTGAAGRPLQQALTEIFVVDMDDAMREMTVGDLAVPRHVKRTVAVLHERYTTFGAALAEPQDDRLLAAIRSQLGGLRGGESLDARLICGYIRQAMGALDQLGDDRLLAGQIEWPDTNWAQHD